MSIAGWFSTVHVLVALGAVVFFALLVRIKSGFGFSIIVLPIASLLIGFDEAVRLSIALEVVIGAVCVVRMAHLVRWRDAITLKLAALFGVAVAQWSSTWLSPAAIVVPAMSILTIYCVLQLVRRQESSLLSLNVASCWGAGSVSGFLGYWTSLSGPPVVLLYARSALSDIEIVAALNGYFLLTYCAAFALSYVSGAYAGFSLWWFVSIAGVGVILLYAPLERLLCGVRLNIRRFAIAMALIAGLAVLAQSLLPQFR